MKWLTLKLSSHNYWVGKRRYKTNFRFFARFEKKLTNKQKQTQKQNSKIASFNLIFQYSDVTA